MSISNRRSRSSRNVSTRRASCAREHIESEIALKPELLVPRVAPELGAYRIGDRAQAGTGRRAAPGPHRSISNRRSRSSRNRVNARTGACSEHIESEIALKPERAVRGLEGRNGAYRIGDRAQAGTPPLAVVPTGMSISNRRSRSSRNASNVDPALATEHIESEIALKPELAHFVSQAAVRAADG